VHEAARTLEIHAIKDPGTNSTNASNIVPQFPVRDVHSLRLILVKLTTTPADERVPDLLRQLQQRGNDQKKKVINRYQEQGQLQMQYYAEAVMIAISESIMTLETPSSVLTCDPAPGESAATMLNVENANFRVKISHDNDAKASPSTTKPGSGTRLLRDRNC
jgi:hypothetical protein